MADAPRSRIFRPRQIFGRTFWIFTALAVTSGVLCYVLKGEEAFRRALDSDLALLLAILPRIIAAMLVAGLLQSILPRELVARWVGEQSGFRGIVIASVAGAITPGGPMASFPLVVALHVSGADRGSLVAYLTAWSLLGVQRILAWEIPLMGADFATVRILASMAMPLIAGTIARRIPLSYGPARHGAAGP